MGAQDILSVRLAEKGIEIVTLNRPDRLNALTREMVLDLNRKLDTLAADRDCRVVVVTGAGRGFCSGQDMVAANSRNRAGGSGVVDRLYWQEQFAGIGARIRAMPQAVIAAVNGPAVGAGMAIALAADVRIASTAACFLVAAVRIGLTGGESGLSYLLPRLIGAAPAFDILLTGRPVDAAEAERIGLVRSVSRPERLLEDALSYADGLLDNSPYSIAHTKKLMWENLDASSYEAAVMAENRTQILGTMTQDYNEATTAFMEKRVPRFRGN